MPCTICKQSGHNRRTCKKESHECAICYDKCDYKLKCGHAFHASCIHSWMMIDPINNNKCPYCQKPIITPRLQILKKEKGHCFVIWVMICVLEKILWCLNLVA